MMIHSMQLQPSPLERMKDGRKTIELRLFDEKRRKIRAGDTVVFTNTATGESIEVSEVDLKEDAALHIMDGVLNRVK